MKKRVFEMRFSRKNVLIESVTDRGSMTDRGSVTDRNRELVSSRQKLDLGKRKGRHRYCYPNHHPNHSILLFV